MIGEIGLGLSITLLSAFALNWGYLREHDAAAQLPPVSVRRPLRSARMLFASRDWVVGFVSESAGWGLFVLALALAPLGLVQAVSAGGIGILAFLVSRFGGRLTRRERIGVQLSIGGLALLGVSLVGGAEQGHDAPLAGLVLWLAASAGGAALATGAGVARLGGGPAFGLAAGTLFAGGDVATKAVVSGQPLFIPVLLGFYGAGTLMLQMGFQRDGALVTAGMATLFTNAIPIVAGAILFAEPLPGGVYGALRVLAFVLVVGSAVFLSRPRNAPSAPRTPPAQRPVGR